MSSESTPPTAPDVAALAVRLKLLSLSDAERLRTSSDTQGIPPLQAGLQLGLFSPETIDIIETLLKPLESVPGYEMLDLLGRGGMGVVYRARQLALNRVVAVKTIRVGRMTDSGSVARFEQEAKTIAQLRHPNIVGAFDFGRHAGRLFLAMEFVDGTDAESFVERHGPLPERTAWAIVRQAAAGLDHAWRRRIVHRDMKPANLLLIEQPEGFSLPPGVPLAMIADFGLAQLSDMLETNTRLTAENLTVGSPHYMAPEQLQSSDVDLRADIYALGVTTWHLLTGATPFRQLNLSQLITRKLTMESIVDASEDQGRLTPETLTLLRRMTARMPQSRPDNYATLIAEIDALPLIRVAAESDAFRIQPTMILPVERGPVEPGPAGTGPVETALLEPGRVEPGGANATRTGTDTVANQATAESLASTSDRTRPAMVSAAGEGQVSESSLADRSPRRSVTNRVLLAMAAIGMFAAGAFGWWMYQHGGLSAVSSGVSNSPPLLRAAVTEGMGQYVFNGTNLSPFKPHAGNWVVPPGEAVIEGTDGELRGFLIRRGSDGQPLPLAYYRLEILTELRNARALWIEFAIAAPNSAIPSSGYAVKLSERQAQLVRRNGPDAAWNPVSEPRSIDPAKKHVVAIERNPAGWFVSIDELPLGAASLSDVPEVPEYRLGVEGGPAWFSDLFVTELESET